MERLTVIFYIPRIVNHQKVYTLMMENAHFNLKYPFFFGDSGNLEAPVCSFGKMALDSNEETSVTRIRKARYEDGSLPTDVFGEIKRRRLRQRQRFFKI